MTKILDVPCHRYRGKDLVAQLVTEPGTVFCPVRQCHYLLRPEEHVRQALLWFLVKGAASAPIWANQLRFAVERNSLDISAFHKAPRTEPHFSPQMPVVIFETKRIERDADDDAATDGQLQGYMIRERCRQGFIFNGRQAAWLSLGGEFTAPTWTKTYIADLSDAETRITQAMVAVATHVAECEVGFKRAVSGDFASLLAIVSEFGSVAGLTFFLSIKSDGCPGLVRAFTLRIENSALITYRSRGTGGKRRLNLTPQNFHALRSIEPLTG